MDNKTRCSVLCRGFQGAQRRAEETGHSSFFFGVEKKGRRGGNVNAGKNTRGALNMPRKTDQMMRRVMTLARHAPSPVTAFSPRAAPLLTRGAVFSDHGYHGACFSIAGPPAFVQCMRTALSNHAHLPAWRATRYRLGELNLVDVTQTGVGFGRSHCTEHRHWAQSGHPAASCLRPLKLTRQRFWMPIPTPLFLSSIK